MDQLKENLAYISANVHLRTEGFLWLHRKNERKNMPEYSEKPSLTSALSRFSFCSHFEFIYTTLIFLPNKFLDSQVYTRFSSTVS